MGASCCGGNKSNKKGEANLKGMDGKVETFPLATVIKAQALMRGFIARRKVKRIYGYEMR